MLPLLKIYINMPQISSSSKCAGFVAFVLPQDLVVVISSATQSARVPIVYSLQAGLLRCTTGPAG